MSVVAFINGLVNAGFSYEDAMKAAAVYEATASVAPVRSKGAERQARYQARLEASGMTAKAWRATSKRIIERDGGFCAYCNTSSAQMCCDHVNPLIEGSGSEDANLVAACSNCNREKSGRTLEQWKGQEWADQWRSKRQMTSETFEDGETLSLPSSPPEPPQLPTHTRGYITTREGKPEPTGFAEFWRVYPNKVGKDAARKAYAAALRRIEGPDPPGELVAGVTRALVGWTDPKFIPHPATWLNQGRWQDELPQITPPRIGREPTSRTPREAAYVDRLSDIDRAMAEACQ